MDSDLPPLESSNESYGRITCPVLILAVSGDEVHPVNTSVAVHKVIQQSQLVVAESETQAAKEWPMLIADFMSTIRKNENNSTCHSAYTALP